ncbi:protein kinase [Streptosporangium sp. NPDC050280]|uniref:protein kinase domain-containing protein n=1 Tax=unclassified Streptosporangium TaxID=2632669 RepID=UPI003436B658
MAEAQPAGRRVASRYQLLEAIGRGGMGIVWRAHDELLDREVAIKEVRYADMLGEDNQEDFNRRTKREARAAGRLTHPNVVVVHDVVEEDGRPWIVMQLVESRSLGKVMRQDGPLPPRRVAEIGLKLLEALRAAHAQGVLHRDVKPENVLLADDGRVVLTDFGIATLEAETALTMTGIAGTPAFIPPERIKGGAAQRESDLWSLGATLYAAVEGKPPHDRGGALPTMHAILNDEPEPPVHAGPLAPVLEGLLRKDPALRMPYKEAERLLRRVAEGDRVRPPRTAVMPAVNAGDDTDPGARFQPGAVPETGAKLDSVPSEPSGSKEEVSAPPARGEEPRKPSAKTPAKTPAEAVRPKPAPAPDVPASAPAAGSEEKAKAAPKKTAQGGQASEAAADSPGPDAGAGARAPEAGAGSKAKRTTGEATPAPPTSSASEAAPPILARFAPKPKPTIGRRTESTSKPEPAAGATPAAEGAPPILARFAPRPKPTTGPEPTQKTEPTPTSAAAAEAAPPILARFAPKPKPTIGQKAEPTPKPAADVTQVRETKPGTAPSEPALPAGSRSAGPEASREGAPPVAEPGAEGRKPVSRPNPFPPVGREPGTEQKPASASRAEPAPREEPAAYGGHGDGGDTLVSRSSGVSPVKRGLLVLVPALLIVGGIAGWLGMRSGDGDETPQAKPVDPSASSASEAPSGGAEATPEGSPSSETSPSEDPSESPSADPSPTKKEKKSPLPSGWRMHKDGNGFSIGLPKGWAVEKRPGQQVWFRGPDRTSFVFVEYVDKAGPDPKKDWENQEGVVRGNFPGYDRIRIANVKYMVKASDWEFTWNTSSGKARVINRGFITKGGRGYAIYWHTLAKDWKKNMHLFEGFTATFSSKK